MRRIIVTTLDELADYSDKWESLRIATKNNIYCSFPLTQIWLDTFSEFASSRAVLVEDGGDLIAIAPMATSRFKIMGVPMTSLSLAGWGPNTLGLVTNSIMCLPGRKDALRESINGLRSIKWSVMFTENMEANGMIQAYIDEANSTWHSQVQAPNKNHVLELKDSGDMHDNFTRNGRMAIKKSLKLVERDGLDMAFREVLPSDIGQAVEKYAQQHIDRWGARGGSYFTNPVNCRFLDRAVRAAYEGGFGSMYEVTIDGDVASQLVVFREGNIAHFYRVGMSNIYSKYSPGRLAIYLAVLSYLDTGIRRCVLGGGDQRFKREMGCIEFPLIGLKATRGMASMVSKVINSRPVRSIDSRLEISDRFIKNLAVERKEGGAEALEQ